jgi:hypothetical protein
MIIIDQFAEFFAYLSKDHTNSNYTIRFQFFALDIAIILDTLKPMIVPEILA